MKYLNVGCGSHYSTKNEWTNIDFAAVGKEVIGHNLLKGIPFPDNHFDLVYHSHVLEHFSKQDGEKFIEECFRVIKPGGIIRIAIPDLERIARKYLYLLEEGIKNTGNSTNSANYDWIMLEMYDQTVRNISGGEMKKYLFQEEMINEQFVFEQIGQEGINLRHSFLSSNNYKTQTKPELPQKISVGFRERISGKLKSYLLKRWNIDLATYEIGKFRLGGEIHQWMYDRYSLSDLLKIKGGEKILVREAFTSYVTDWKQYELDEKNNTVRKPDSLFMEAIKK